MTRANGCDSIGVMTNTCVRCTKIAELLAELIEQPARNPRQDTPAPPNDSVVHYIWTYRVDLGIGETPIQALHADYLEWCSEFGIEPVNIMRFGRTLSSHGVGTRRSTGGVKIRTGIRLVAEADREM